MGQARYWLRAENEAVTEVDTPNTATDSITGVLFLFIYFGETRKTCERAKRAR